MYLKTLTLRGFKSFASATTLRFEPGITCVVGPNGSGKSNVVDALSWVMGEQGAKSLRGGKMEDVIFAGTSGRPPLGRAEVVLTIDNTDGALPIDYSEVTIARTMFRNGGSEYAINGESCRLLDVQELLSDSGIGREMHVIVGQGQLDSVLSATPEDRRGFIEEAAGVLKHRKRKEKALRKLESMEANLVRLTDLTTELRRQLKPLGRQAEVAKRASVIQSDVRDARLRILADDLFALRVALQQEVADESALLEMRAVTEKDLADITRREAELEQAVAESLPALTSAQETWFRLSALADRFRGTATLASERVRHDAEVPADERSGREPEDMEREAGEIRDQESRLADQVAADRATLARLEQQRIEVERLLSAEEQRVASLLRAIADRREGMARLAGQVNAARSTADAAAAEHSRLEGSVSEAKERARHAQEEFAALEAQIAGLDAGEVDLDSEHELASDALASAEERIAALREEERAAEQERAALVARKEALELGLARKDGSGALLAATDRLSGVLGSVAALLTVEPGAEAAVAAALGNAADAVAVDSVGVAVDALRLLKTDDGGRAGLLVGGGTTHGSVGWPALPAHATYAVDLVMAPDTLRPAIRQLLERVAVVEGLAEARALIESQPELVAATRDGDLLGRAFSHGGSASSPSLLEVQAAVDEASERLSSTTHRCERLRFSLAQVGEERESARGRVEAALARLHESDARLAAVAEQLGQLGSAARSATAEAQRQSAAIEAAQSRHVTAQAALVELEERLAAAENAPDVEEPATDDRDRLATDVAAARHAETEARLAVRTGEERARALHGRADQLDKAAVAERDAREMARRRRERAAREAEVGRAVLRACDIVLSRLDQSINAATIARAEAERARTAFEGELLAVRGRGRELAADLEQLTSSVHRDEVARTEQRLRIEQIETRALEEFGVDGEALLAEYGPDQLVPPSPLAPDEQEPEQPREAIPFVRADQEKRLRSAERALALLGRVNPLALEEFSAMEERQQFLTEQLEDLKKTRRDLLDIIREVDDRVEQVFTEAYHDVAREFVKVFARLFPGGEGKLILTDPSDMLASGVDIEARPPGKKIKRLSLLSGGERSLTAVAFLVALFKARPSPFYVLDEVEAALDDTNLGRLLDIYEELRENSQLIVITHQKRTMEVADALYGVSMRGDGVSAVISQRLREAESA
ncbi:MAG TPA: chromosome segregation protein SMC [Actinomycetes bacterium]|nr:chromosome segregation protein SMC [Actinomycetes bacterium]